MLVVVAAPPGYTATSPCQILVPTLLPRSHFHGLQNVVVGVAPQGADLANTVLEGFDDVVPHVERGGGAETAFVGDSCVVPVASTFRSEDAILTTFRSRSRVDLLDTGWRHVYRGQVPLDVETNIGHRVFRSPERRIQL